MSKKKSTKFITERAVRRAFARVLRNPAELEAAVAKFMSGNPVPPAWGLAGVRAELGPRVARAWARHLRHLSGAYYRNPETGENLFPVVQHMADVSAEKGQLWRKGHRPPAAVASNTLIIMDESWSMLTDPEYMRHILPTVSAGREFGADLVARLLEATQRPDSEPVQPKA